MTSGTYKNIGNPFTDLTPEQLAHLQGVLDDTYQHFTATVSKARKISLSSVNEWGDGKIFTSDQALKLGLIDEIGSAQNAIAVIKDKALIEGEIEWVHPPKPGGFFGLFGGGEQDGDEGSMLNSVLAKACTFLESRYGTARMQ